MMTWFRCLLIFAVMAVPCAAAGAQPDLTPEPPRDKHASDLTTEAPSRDAQVVQLMYALVRLPVAAAFASVLALRPSRRGTR